MDIDVNGPLLILYVSGLMLGAVGFVVWAVSSDGRTEQAIRLIRRLRTGIKK